MNMKQIEALAVSAKALIDTAKQLGCTLDELLASLKGDPVEAEFAPCLKCGTEGPITTYRAQDGSLKRVTWCTKCGTKRA